MKNILLLSVLLLVGCASYPNYYIKDSTITTQETTQAYQQPYYGGYGGWNNNVVYVPPVWGNGYWGGWYGNSWGWGWRGWGCW